MRDEGGPLEAGSQIQASNRCKLRSSRAIVVSVAEMPRLDFGRCDPERRAQANLFCGSDAGGQRAACFYTIVETCKLNGIDPHAYLTDILGRIADHPINKIADLLPWHWTE